MKKILALLGLVAAAVWVARRIGFRFGPMPPPVPPVPPVAPDHELYVADMGANRIVCFAIKSDGRIESPPWRIIDGFNNSITGLQNPFDVAVTDDGEIWVVNLGASPGQSGNSPSITIYDAGSAGAAAPTFTISPGHPPSFINPTAVAWRENPANLLVLDSALANVQEFTKSQTPTGSAINFGVPAGVAIDLQGRLYVTDQTAAQNAVWFLSMAANQSNQTTLSRITGPATGLNSPAHLATDTQGKIYVVNRGSQNPVVQNPSITVYAAGAAGDVAPLQLIAGHSTELSAPYGIAVDESGRIFVSDNRRVLMFAAGATGNAAPDRIVAYPEFSSLAGLAVR